MVSMCAPSDIRIATEMLERITMASVKAQAANEGKPIPAASTQLLAVYMQKFHQTLLKLGTKPTDNEQKKIFTEGLQPEILKKRVRDKKNDAEYETLRGVMAIAMREMRLLISCAQTLGQASPRGGSLDPLAGTTAGSK